jgi:hypothetical protein
MLSTVEQHTADNEDSERQNSSNDTSPGAVATITAAGDALDHYGLTVTVPGDEQGLRFGQAQQQYDSSADGAPQPFKQHSARAFISRLASSLSRMSSSRARTTDGAPDPAAIRAAASGMDINDLKSAFSAASGNSRFEGLAASKRRLLANWASWR